MIKDYLGRVIADGDHVVYAANRGVRQGQVLKVNKYVGDYDTHYTVTIMVEYEPGKFKKQTIGYVQEKFWRVS